MLIFNSELICRLHDIHLFAVVGYGRKKYMKQNILLIQVFMRDQVGG